MQTGYLYSVHLGVPGVSQYINVHASSFPFLTLQVLHPSYQEVHPFGISPLLFGVSLEVMYWVMNITDDVRAIKDSRA